MLGNAAFTGGFVAFIVVISIWSLIWKGISLWKCGRNNQLAWFVILLIFNTAGILPIIYLLFFQPKAVKKRAVPKKTGKKVVKKK
tara:strand:- start:5 stop:259 length:255 start_codon:yes stop_codon:yes gene_type:complete